MSIFINLFSTALANAEVIMNVVADWERLCLLMEFSWKPNGTKTVFIIASPACWLTRLGRQ